MKVLAVSTWCPVPPDNGSRLRAYHLLRALSAKHDVTLVMFGDRDMSRDTRDGLRSLVSRVQTVPGSPFVRRTLTTRGLFSTTPRSLTQAHDADMQQLVDRLAPECDVALGMQINAAIYLRHLRVPKVFEEAEVGVLRDQPRRARGLVRTRRWLMWRKSAHFMRGLTRHFERTTVVSPHERTLLVDLGADPSRLVVIPNGVDERDLLRPRPPRVRRIIYPGSLTYAANFDAVRDFLQTTWPLLTELPGLEFVVTGSLDGVDIASLPHSDRVRFTGRLDDVKSVIAESTAVVVPLRVGGGTRLKILEAMALGTPVISTEKGAEGLDLVAGEHVLIADEPDAWLRHVRTLSSDPGLATRLSDAGRALVARNYRWSASGATLDRTLEDACMSAERPTS